HTTKQPHANTLALLYTVPGSGAILSLVLLDAIHDIARVPRGQDFVSDCCLVQCAKAAAGKRYGTAGTKIGQAYLQWACNVTPPRTPKIRAETSWHRERHAAVWLCPLPPPDGHLPPPTPQAPTGCPPQRLAAVTTCRSEGGCLTRQAFVPRCRRIRGSPTRGPPGKFPPGPVPPVVGFRVPSSRRRWEHGLLHQAPPTGRRA